MKFTESPNTAVFTTKFVIYDKKEITYVTHDIDDGAWQFFSNDDFNNFEDVAKIICLSEIIEIDPTLLELAEMPEGYIAYRKFKGDNWIIEERKKQ